jgi:hypothetical protein
MLAQLTIVGCAPFIRMALIPVAISSLICQPYLCPKLPNLKVHQNAMVLDRSLY